MENTEETEYEETFEEPNINSIKTEYEETIEESNVDSITNELEDGYNTIDDNVVEYLVADSNVVEYHLNPPKPRRGRPRKNPYDTKSQAQASLLKANYNTTAELKLRPKYRPIRPKPYQPNLGRNKVVNIPPAINVTPLNSQNRILVTTPLLTKEKGNGMTLLNNSNSKTNNTKTSSEIQIKENAVGGNRTGNISQKLIKIPSVKKGSDKSNKGSIELFFQSMAQTVMNLPTQVQAEIKMEICRIITMAELKYSSQSKQNFKTN